MDGWEFSVYTMYVAPKKKKKMCVSGLSTEAIFSTDLKVFIEENKIAPKNYCNFQGRNMF